MGVHRPQLTKCMLHSFHLDWPFNVFSPRSSYPSTLNLLPHVLLLSSIFLPVSCLFDAECVTFPCLTHVFFFGELCARNHCTYTEMLIDIRTRGPILYRETGGKPIWNVKHNSTQRSTAGSQVSTEKLKLCWVHSLVLTFISKVKVLLTCWDSTMTAIAAVTLRPTVTTTVEYTDSQELKRCCFFTVKIYMKTDEYLWYQVDAAAACGLCMCECVSC